MIRDAVSFLMGVCALCSERAVIVELYGGGKNSIKVKSSNMRAISADSIVIAT
jgi:hypothetical protein